jgi:hypothetical protein
VARARHRLRLRADAESDLAPREVKAERPGILKALQLLFGDARLFPIDRKDTAVSTWPQLSGVPCAATRHGPALIAWQHLFPGTFGLCTRSGERSVEQEEFHELGCGEG